MKLESRACLFLQVSRADSEREACFMGRGPRRAKFPFRLRRGGPSIHREAAEKATRKKGLTRREKGQLNLLYEIAAQFDWPGGSLGKPHILLLHFQ